MFVTLSRASLARGVPESLILEIRSADSGRRAYRIVDNWAFSYRSTAGEFPRPLLSVLDRVIARAALVLSEFGFHPATDVFRPAAERLGTVFPTPWHHWYLEGPASVSPESVHEFRQNGQVLIRRALRRDIILAARSILVSEVKRAWPAGNPPAEERKDAYSQAFTQIVDIGLSNPLVRVFTHSRRIGHMAAILMGVDSVRLFCEDWLIKEPGARITPWHQDEAVFPFDARETITCWIPFRDIHQQDGLLRFAKGSHRLGLAPIENINDISEDYFASLIEERRLSVETLASMSLGDVSFHHGRTIHGAHPNASDEARIVLALHFFAGDARLKAPTTPTMARLLTNAVREPVEGAPAISSRWPLVYDPEPPKRALVSSSAEPAFHVRATRVDTGRPIEIWLHRGRVRLNSIEGARQLAKPGGFILPGLVDSHSHISYPHELDAPVSSLAWMNARRDDYAATGVLLLRDMGAVDDAITQLADAPGLPRVQSTGNMILPYDEPPFTCTRPEHLVRACVERIERGAQWIKVFADWTNDFLDHVDPGFGGDDQVAYPLELLKAAVAAVHSLGGRVAAHCFTRAGAEVAILANVDSLEHGWGLDEELIAKMAERQIAWVPLVGIASAIQDDARRAGSPMERVEWVEETMRSLARVLPFAEASGVKVFAGTDRFPEVTVVDEIRQLSELGLSRPAALAAGSWQARSWLGEPGLDEGAPADFVLYREDPRLDFDALLRPELIMLGGKRVDASFDHVRPVFRTWREVKS